MTAQRISYLVARAAEKFPGDWNKPTITYSPPAKEGDELWIGVYEGRHGHDNGGETSAKNVLERPGLLGIVEMAGGMWFVPMIQRMAAGEHVTLDELSSEYRRVHGTEIEFTVWGSYFPCEQAALDICSKNQKERR
jgi:hypothetical protein